jgi:hypothetical protein
VDDTCNPIILATWEAVVGRNFVQGQPWKTRAKWTGSMVQVVQCLPCKCKILSSNPRPTKKKKKGNQRARLTNYSLQAITPTVFLYCSPPKNFLAVVGLNSGPHACYVGALPLEPSSQPFFFFLILNV